MALKYCPNCGYHLPESNATLPNSLPYWGAQVKMRNTAGGSNKFWNIQRTGARIYAEYGPIGFTGQQNTKVFSTFEDAQKYLDDKVREKMQHGYYKVSWL